MVALDAGTKTERYAGRRWRYEVALGALGALGAGGLGIAVAGGIGLGIGLAVGAAAGALAAWAIQDQEQETAARDSQLDLDIGVFGGDLGAAEREDRPSTSSEPSAEASGASSDRQVRHVP